MPVDSTSPKYDKFIEQQKKCRDANEGEHEIKKKSVAYLPLLSGMTADSDKYKSYLSRAMFFSATSRTVEGLSGVIDRKPPVINISSGLNWEADIDGTGTTLHGFATALISEAVLIGWQGILVDVREGYEHPYPVQYLSEQIINWHYENDVLAMVMLEEDVSIVDDEHKTTVIKQWRELSIFEGLYTVTVYRKSKSASSNTSGFEVVDFYMPDIRGERLTAIPFVFVSRNGKLEKPPLMDMIEVNFHHYKNSADYEHGLHFTGLPTGYISGLSQPTDKEGNNIPIELGSETCLILGEGGSAGFMEFTGQGLSALVTAMESKKQEMASLGARLLQTDKKAAEAAETARINKSGDSNVIASIVTGVESGLNMALSIMSIWQSVNPEENTIEMNREFVDQSLTAQDLTAIVGSVQGGTMSLETAVTLHQRNEMLAKNRTVEEEISAIKSQAPALNGDSLDLSGNE